MASSPGRFLPDRGARFGLELDVGVTSVPVPVAVPVSVPPVADISDRCST